MTSLVAWAGVDSHGPASLYIATDSRISWGRDSTWDNGRKVFAGKNGAEVFGYVGDVLFPSLVLGQIADAPANPVIDGSSADARFTAVGDVIQAAFQALPAPEQRPFQIAHAQRIGEGMKSFFRLSSLSWHSGLGWLRSEEHVPSVSNSIVIWGSGADNVKVWKDRWDSSTQGGTSRAIFSALCDAIGRDGDPLSGGAPQLVALYRKGPGRVVGIVHAGQPFVFGLPTKLGSEACDLEWRNHLFERCDKDGHRLPTAKRHLAPKGLGRYAHRSRSS
jgi:hypothetical protein